MVNYSSRMELLLISDVSEQMLEIDYTIADTVAYETDRWIADILWEIPIPQLHFNLVHYEP